MLQRELRAPRVEALGQELPGGFNKEKCREASEDRTVMCEGAAAHCGGSTLRAYCARGNALRIAKARRFASQARPGAAQKSAVLHRQGLELRSDIFGTAEYAQAPLRSGQASPG